MTFKILRCSHERPQVAILKLIIVRAIQKFGIVLIVMEKPTVRPNQPPLPTTDKSVNKQEQRKYIDSVQRLLLMQTSEQHCKHEI